MTEWYSTQEQREHWQKYLVAEHCRRLREAGIWWSIPALWDTIKGMQWGWDPMPEEQFNQEFLRALENGLFGHRPKERVMVLNPHDPAPWLRLTAVRARQVIETVGMEEFVRKYIRQAWMEISRAHSWLATLLEPPLFERWLKIPVIEEGLGLAK